MASITAAMPPQALFPRSASGNAAEKPKRKPLPSRRPRSPDGFANTERGLERERKRPRLVEDSTDTAATAVSVYGERFGAVTMEHMRMETALRLSGTKQAPLSCPYRKRNRTRFNIRDHPGCANAFQNISILKKHVGDCHLTRPCTIRALPQSQQRDQAKDVEDGIGKPIADLLTKRKARLKIHTWESLWQILFPDDKEVPSPSTSLPFPTSMLPYLYHN
ncbi:hypothetical protein B0T21DRAFT_49240 [Apiosordaria backusii]|uniref:C2H2-type domain-containing protein n=1 Tax=Apiosordaria backusii TaxID=314023 RepID=A0AA40E1Y0_9PEZI|nr:hypothetical protein B0T21DRAFT_49240 [Apiosordaria backusii]